MTECLTTLEGFFYKGCCKLSAALTLEKTTRVIISCKYPFNDGVLPAGGSLAISDMAKVLTGLFFTYYRKRKLEKI